MSESDNQRNTPGALDARTMILDLFAAYEGGRGYRTVLSTKEILLVGEVLELAPSAIRTAITRLKQEGRLQAMGRGLYTYGQAVDPWRQRIDGWRVAATRRRPWDGAWLMAIIKPASLSRTGWRATLRALELEGFRRTGDGLWLRPDNLEGLDRTRDRLLAYGASDAMLTARITDLDEASLKAVPSLWEADALAEEHRRLARQIEASLNRIRHETSDSAAREALVLGRAGVRAIVRDPLLPDDMADSEPLETLADAMGRYESVGKAVWTRRFRLIGVERA